MSIPFKPNVHRDLALRWLPHPSCLPAHSPVLRLLLQTPDSLTRLCIQGCEGRFSVLPLMQSWSRPHVDEARVLDISRHQVAFVRHVKLLCNGRTLIFARTVIPAKTLQGKTRRLSHLGNRSLGAFLFRFRSLEREPGQYCTLTPSQCQDLAGIDPGDTPCFARRHIYRVASKPLLITEMFVDPEGICP